MEYVDSDTLRNRRLDQPSGVFQPAHLGPWTMQLCDALDYAHQHAAIVHRDPKPANLLINTRNHLKVADFGISRSIVESVTQVTGHVSSGTLVYMSPQQLDGDPSRPPDDIYAVGATLYELCASRPPFYTGDVYRQVHATFAHRQDQARAQHRTSYRDDQPGRADFSVNGPDGPAGALHATSPWNSDKLPIGDYEITINRVGVAPFSKRVSLTKNGTLPVAFDLTAGTVQIDSNPPGATVVFEAKPMGQTPITLNEVPPGNVQYSLAVAGYPAVSVQGLVEPGQVLQLNGGGNGDDDDDNNSSNNRRHGDSLDKANRAADLMNKLRWMGSRFPHP